MPGNLSVATVSPTNTVFPQSLSTAFTLATSFPMLSNVYKDGTVERGLITDGVNPARQARVWTLNKRLTTAQLTTLLNFWETVQGGYKPFWFYDPYQPAPGQKIGSNYDPTGISTQGRVKVIFRGANWSHVTGIGRHDVQGLVLVEVA